MPPITTPLPAPNTTAVQQTGIQTDRMASWFQSVHALLTSAIFNWTTIQENGNEVLTVAGGRTITGGFQETEVSLGTPTNGSTVTPNPGDSLKQTLTNNVAGFTIAATAQVGDVELRIVNGASAGTITFSGFDKQWAGDSLDTTSGHQFIAFIYGFGAKKAYILKALQ
jgi:hypothetical protein